MFGGVCKKCRPSAIVESISAESLNCSEEPEDRETLLVINNSNIIFDRFKVATEGESECVHLFGGDNRRMVGCGVNSADNSNDDDLIYKTKANAYDTIFHVKPPGVAIFPIPYLWENADKISQKLVPQIF